MFKLLTSLFTLKAGFKQKVRQKSNGLRRKSWPSLRIAPEPKSLIRNTNAFKWIFDDRFMKLRECLLLSRQRRYWFACFSSCSFHVKNRPFYQNRLIARKRKRGARQKWKVSSMNGAGGNYLKDFHKIFLKISKRYLTLFLMESWPLQRDFRNLELYLLIALVSVPLSRHTACAY